MHGYLMIHIIITLFMIKFGKLEVIYIIYYYHVVFYNLTLIFVSKLIFKGDHQLNYI